MEKPREWPQKAQTQASGPLPSHYPLHWRGRLAGDPPPALLLWPRLLCSLASPSLMASLLSLMAPVLASSRRPDPSAMEVEHKKLKGKRDLIMPKSFQQVDFWCK